MARDPNDNSDSAHSTSGDTLHEASDLLRRNEPDVDEQDIPVGRQISDIVCLTPESAVGGTLMNSPAGSGPLIYEDFLTAIRDGWGVMEQEYSTDGMMPLRGEAVPPELREARRGFMALQDRFKAHGFSTALAKELEQLCWKYSDSCVVEISYVLPEGLQTLLDEAFDHLEGQCEDDEEYAEALASAPPRDTFDLHDPKHMQWLEEHLQFLQDY